MMPSNVLPFPRDGQITEDDYSYASRLTKVYSITECELEMLETAPWWTRRRIIRRLRAETTFKD